MASLTLHADQAALADELAAASGLDPVVARAWVGTASGWGVYRHDHDYLTPGRHFPTVGHAARSAAAVVVRDMPGAVVAGPLVQLRAIADATGVGDDGFERLTANWTGLAAP